MPCTCSLLVLPAQEVFTRATAHAYQWAPAPANAVPVEAEVNDVALDAHLAAAVLAVSEGGSERTTPAGMTHSMTNVLAAAHCPIVCLSRKDVETQLKLVPDGLLGRGQCTNARSLLVFALLH
jgi:hypothetical protein